MNIFNAGSLNGLDQLTTLCFIDSTISGFSSGALNSVASTLRYLELVEPFYQSNPLLVNGLTGTGSSQLYHLETIRVRYNLLDTITSRTFSAVVNLRSLDLAECRIEVIGAGAFDAFASTITMINLRQNRLKQLPIHFFPSVMLSRSVTIRLEGNHWHCDCDLCYVKDLINYIGNNELTCQTPSHYWGASIARDDFCFDSSGCEALINIDRPPLTTTPATVERTCSKSEDGDGSIQLTSATTGKVSLNIDRSGMVSLHYSTTLLPFWFLWSQKSNEFSCSECYQFNNAGTSSVIITTIDNASSAQLFCIIPMGSTRIPPLYCFTYVLDVRPFIWVLNSNKVGTVFIYLLINILALIIGAVCGWLTMFVWNKRSGNVTNLKPQLGTNEKVLDNATSNRKVDETKRKLEPIEELSRFDIVKKDIEMKKDREVSANYYYEMPPSSVNVKSKPVVLVEPELPPRPKHIINDADKSVVEIVNRLPALPPRFNDRLAQSARITKNDEPIVELTYDVADRDNF